jgi:hypothetical protein
MKKKCNKKIISGSLILAQVKLPQREMLQSIQKRFTKE